MMRVKIYDTYRIGSDLELTPEQILQLINRFQSPITTPATTLGGRGAVARQSIAGIGAVVVKQYLRGGIIRHMTKNKYLKCGKTRGLKEYELLQTVRNLGINAPEPLAWADRGKRVYSAWLVTRQIYPSRSLMQLSLENENLARQMMKSTAEQIKKLIQNKILHVDCHPGNVIVDAKGRVFLLDFDKGRIYRGDERQLQARYFARWKRAVVKHKLPDLLIDAMRYELKENQD